MWQTMQQAGSLTHWAMAKSLLLFLLGGCAGVPDRISQEPTADACYERFTQADKRIDSVGLRDAADHRVERFPWLRTDRFLTSRQPDVSAQDGEWEIWLEKLHKRDLEARRYEHANLHGLPPEHAQLDTLLDSLADCGRELNQLVLGDEALREQIADAAEVPDDYRTVNRWLGLYPISRWFVLAGVANLHAEQEAALVDKASPGKAALTIRYSGTAPDEQSTDLEGRIKRDPLDRPRPSPPAREALLDRHAPVWELHTESHADRIGKPRWRGSERPQVDTDEPTEYRYLTWAEFEGEPVLQLNYLVWLPERPARDGLLERLLTGHMDGLIWRVTLDAEGEVLAGESLHTCACYYMVFPGPELEPRDDPPGGEPAFIGPTLPQTDDSQRLVLTREASSHYLIHIETTDADRGNTELDVRPANQLRSLPHPEGRRSLYGEDGIVPGTQRAERWLLWPMGVRSAGAMRQPGRHAIAFAGVRHFDAPDLLEQHFHRSEQD